MKVWILQKRLIYEDASIVAIFSHRPTQKELAHYMPNPNAIQLNVSSTTISESGTKYYLKEWPVK